MFYIKVSKLYSHNFLLYYHGSHPNNHIQEKLLIYFHYPSIKCIHLNLNHHRLNISDYIQDQQDLLQSYSQEDKNQNLNKQYKNLVLYIQNINLNICHNQFDLLFHNTQLYNHKLVQYHFFQKQQYIFHKDLLHASR